MTSRELRKLGNLEQYSSSRHSLGLHTCIINTCEYSIPQWIQQSGQLKVWFLWALRNVIFNIPSLRVCIKDEASNLPAFAWIPTMKLSDHLTWKQHTSRDADNNLPDLAQILEEEHTKGFTDVDRQPPWRIMCIEPSIGAKGRSTKTSATLYVLFAVHHSIADGISTKSFHEALLNCLNQARANVDHPDAVEDMISFAGPPKFPNALENMLRFNISWPFFLKTLWREFGPKLPASTDSEQPWTGGAYSLTPNQTNVRLVVVPARTLSRLLQICRARATTLTPLIHAIILYAMTKSQSDHDAKAFSAQTPLNLRPFFEESTNPKVAQNNEAFGDYVTSVAHQLDRSMVQAMREASTSEDDVEAMWKVASKIHADLKSRRQLIPNDDVIGLLPYINDFHAHFKGKLGRRRETTWEISNIGSFSSQIDDDDNQNSCKIIQSIFTQPANIIGPAFSANVSGVQSAGLTISLCWQEDVVKKELMDAVAGFIEAAFDMVSTEG